MKKFILMLLLCSTSVAFSCTQCECPRLLDIIIKNNTQTDCHLIQQDIKQGSMHTKDLPLTILAGQESKPYRFLNESRMIGADVVLSFQCGNDKFVTFESQKNIDRNWVYPTDYTITDTILSLSNLDASNSKAQPACGTKPYNPLTITWTLN